MHEAPALFTQTGVISTNSRIRREMRCPYCRAQITHWGAEHGCSWPKLSSGDPPTPEDFRGSDEGSHYMASKQGLWELSEGLNEDLHEARTRQRFRDEVDRLERNRKTTMIRNDREYQITLDQIEKFEEQLKLKRQKAQEENMPDEELHLITQAEECMLEDLVWERDLYDRLRQEGLSAVPTYAPEERGKTLIALRIARGLKQKDLAEALGVSEPQVSRDENNDYHGITLHRYARILEVLGVEEHVAGYQAREATKEEKDDTEEGLPKQWVILRKDLNMRKGKMVSQGGHGVLKVILEQMVRGPEKGKFTLWASGALLAWLDGIFTKICLSASSEEELLEVYDKARVAGIMCTLITDAGRTEFGGVPTNTCVVLGPAYPEQVESFVSHLPLL